MKGVILAGGSASRLRPITSVICKQLLPVYDKPMIYYPLSVLMLAGIRDIIIVANNRDLPAFKELLGNGTQLGIKLSYVVQGAPRGIADGLLITESHVGSDDVCLILGDNIFYGSGFGLMLREIGSINDGVIFGSKVTNPQDYGVVEFSNHGEPTTIIEKPDKPVSNFAIPGLYFYRNTVFDIIRAQTPSARGELEITDLNNHLLKENKLKLILLDRGTAWLDTGSFNTLNDASNFVRVIEERQNRKIGCIEEVAFILGYIGKLEVEKAAMKYSNSPYGLYLKNLL